MNNHISLPQNWKWANFGDIAVEKLIGLVRGSKEQDPSREYQYIKMDSIQLDGSLNLDIVTKVDALPEEVERYSLRKGDFLFNTRNSHELVGKTAVFDSDDKDWIYNNNIMRVRFSEDVDPYFMNFAFHSPLVKAQLEAAKSKTTSVCAIYDYQLVKIKVPLPSIATQRKIASILDKADEIRRKRQQAIKLTEELGRSLFLDMFGDPVTNPKGWNRCCIKDIANVKTGKTPSRKEADNYGGSIRWVKTTEVIDSVIEDTEEHLTEKGASQMTIFPEKSIVLAMYGQGKTRGRTGLLANPSSTNQACAVILPSSKYNTIYLWELLKLSYHKLRELGRGGNQPNLNLDMVKTFEICLPPLKNQIKFENLVSRIQTQKTRIIKSLDESENLFNSLLQRAFKGEL